MKKIVFSLCGVGLFVSASSFADSVCKSKYGTLKCNVGTVSEISYTGLVDADGTTVTDMVDVLGSITAINSHFNNVSVKGETHFTKTDLVGDIQVTGSTYVQEVSINSKSKITGDFYANHTRLNGVTTIVGTIDCEFCVFKSETNINGEVTTERSQFENTLTLSIKKATFSDTKLNDVLVRKHDQNETQTIYLKNGSRANNITFESQNGVILLDDSSQIVGKVQGGKIIKG